MAAVLRQLRVGISMRSPVPACGLHDWHRSAFLEAPWLRHGGPGTLTSHRGCSCRDRLRRKLSAGEIEIGHELLGHRLRALATQSYLSGAR